MSDKFETMGIFEQLRNGLEDSIAHARGKLSLRTTTLPAPPPTIRPVQLAALRKKLKMSQAVFAATLNVSTKTVQSWEQGTRVPSDAALRMIDVVAHVPEVMGRIFAENGRQKGARRDSRRNTVRGPARR